jgi:DNA polymerase family B
MKHFVNDTTSYRRNITLIPTYVNDAATYLSRQTGKPVDECKQFIERSLQPGGQFELKIPQAMVLVRGKNGDRVMTEMRFDEFLDSVHRNRQILSPSMTAYMHPDDKESLLARYIKGNLALRQEAKHKAQTAEMLQDELSYAIFESMQTTYKIKNNGLSGAHTSPYTILFNKSAHSTLTSTCRTATSYANANNEKFLYGNRHYYAPDVVKTNIVSIVNHSDLVGMQNAMDRHGLVPPTTDQVMACIERSTESYWRGVAQMALIRRLVESLSPIEKAAFLYTSDMYHLAAHNPSFVRQFLTALSSKAVTPLSPEESITWVKSIDSNLRAHVSMLCAIELRGEEFKTLFDRPLDLGIVAATAKTISEAMDNYEDFIRAFWVTDNLPSSIFYIPNIVRRGVITSDTDSTIFSVDYWTEWHQGRLDASPESDAIASAAIYLSGQLIRHILATLSGNMGVAQQHINSLSMKNEFYYRVFVPTSRAKHYYALPVAKEGNILPKAKMDIKGVALRNSNVPPHVTAQAHAMKQRIIDTVSAGKKLSIREIMGEVAFIERDIRNSIESGQYDLLKRVQVRDATSYKNPESSPFIHYGLWEEVFASKYGHAAAPPYGAIKVSIDADSPTKIKAWLARMEDQVIAGKMKAWLDTTNRRSVTQLLLPESVLSNNGVPPEIVKGINTRNIVVEMMEGFYLVLESIGIYIRNANTTRLVSDQPWLIDHYQPPAKK